MLSMRVHAPRIVIFLIAMSADEDRSFLYLTDIGYANTIVARYCEYLVALLHGTVAAVVLQSMDMTDCQSTIKDILDHIKPLPLMVIFYRHNSV
ncbi:hypothetical protein [Kaarinaea lacus]